MRFVQGVHGRVLEGDRGGTGNHRSLSGARKDVSEVKSGRRRVVRKGIFGSSDSRIVDFGVAGVVEIVVDVVVRGIAGDIVLVVLVAWDGSEDLEFTTEDHGKTFTTEGFFDSGKARTVSPFVELTTKSVGFDFYETQLTCSELTMTAGSVDMGDRGVYDRGFGRATNLRQVGEEGC